MFRIFLITFLFLAFASTISAQQPETLCPKVVIKGAENIITPGEIINFEAEITGDIYKYPVEFNWKIDRGTIFYGQGTTILRVKTDGLEQTMVTAVVEIKGLPRECKNIFTESSAVGPREMFCSIYDYEKIPWNNEASTLDSFIIHLRNDPNLKGYILINLDKNQTFEDGRKHINQIINHIKFRDFPTKRFIFSLEKSEKFRAYYYLLLNGAEIPECGDCEIIRGSSF